MDRKKLRLDPGVRNGLYVAGAVLASFYPVNELLDASDTRNRALAVVAEEEPMSPEEKIDQLEGEVKRLESEARITTFAVADRVCKPGGDEHYFAREGNQARVKKLNEYIGEVRTTIATLDARQPYDTDFTLDNVFVCDLEDPAAKAVQINVDGHHFIGLDIRNANAGRAHVVYTGNDMFRRLFQEQVAHVYQNAPSSPSKSADGKRRLASDYNWRQQVTAKAAAKESINYNQRPWISKQWWGYLQKLATAKGYPENTLSLQVYDQKPKHRFNKNFLGDIFSEVEMTDDERNFVFDLLLFGGENVMLDGTLKLLDMVKNKREWRVRLGIKNRELAQLRSQSRLKSFKAHLEHEQGLAKHLRSLYDLQQKDAEEKADKESAAIAARNAELEAEEKEAKQELSDKKWRASAMKLASQLGLGMLSLTLLWEILTGLTLRKSKKREEEPAPEVEKNEPQAEEPTDPEDDTSATQLMPHGALGVAETMVPGSDLSQKITRILKPVPGPEDKSRQ